DDPVVAEPVEDKGGLGPRRGQAGNAEFDLARDLAGPPVGPGPYHLADLLLTGPGEVARPGRGEGQVAPFHPVVAAMVRRRRRAGADHHHWSAKAMARSARQVGWFS